MIITENGTFYIGLQPGPINIEGFGTFGSGTITIGKLDDQYDIASFRGVKPDTDSQFTSDFDAEVRSGAGQHLAVQLTGATTPSITVNTHLIKNVG